MPVTLTGQEGFFTREGVIIGEYNRVAALYGSALTAGAQSIWVQFASTDQQAVNGLWDSVEAYRLSGQSYQTLLQTDGQTAIVLQTNRQGPTTLVPYTVAQGISVVAAQMRSTAQSINRPTLAVTVTPDAANLGDATVVASTTNQFGDPLDMIFTEDIVATCTVAPAVSSYQADLAVVGETAQNPITYLWPGGSGASTTLAVTDPAVDGIVTDGSFESWSGTGSNTPDNWEIINGDAGVTIFRSASGGVRGDQAAIIQSDGAQATQLGQDITLEVNTVYAVCVYAKINTLTATGTFRIALTDNNSNVLLDDAGNSLSYTRNVNGEVTTSFQCFTAFFATPRQLPVTVRVQTGFSVAATSGRQLTVDLVGVVAATQLYTGGIYSAAFAGADRTALDDSYTLAVSNSLSTQSFARGMDRLYSMRELGLYFPSSLSATISDGLVSNP